MRDADIPEILWLTQTEEHDYPAAGSYLCLIYAPQKVAALVQALRDADYTKFKAKDIFRASRLSLLGVSNSHVERDLHKIKNGVALSPLLLVRDENNAQVVIADGYHRLCAIYACHEDAEITCKIV